MVPGLWFTVTNLGTPRLGWLVLVQADVTLAGWGVTDCTLWKPASTEWLYWKLGWHILVQVAPNYPGLSWYATMLQSLFLILPRNFAFEPGFSCTTVAPTANLYSAAEARSLIWGFDPVHSLPCFSFVVEMQSAAKSWILSPHLKLQVVSIWKNMETFTGVIPLALIAAATQQTQLYTAERDETVALFYLLN